MALLEVNDLRVTLNTSRGPAKALRGVSFSVERGQTLGLIGESGCGKSLTVMRRSARQLLVMYAGTVVESGPTASVFQRMAHPYTRGLTAARPRLGLPRGTRLPTIPGRVPELTDMPPGCPFAPRCGLTVAECLSGPPPVVEVEVGVGHQARCLFAADAEAVT